MPTDDDGKGESDGGALQDSTAFVDRGVIAKSIPIERSDFLRRLTGKYYNSSSGEDMIYTPRCFFQELAHVSTALRAPSRTALRGSFKNI